MYYVCLYVCSFSNWVLRLALPILFQILMDLIVRRRESAHPIVLRNQQWWGKGTNGQLLVGIGEESNWYQIILVIILFIPDII